MDVFVVKDRVIAELTFVEGSAMKLLLKGGKGIPHGSPLTKVFGSASASV